MGFSDKLIIWYDQNKRDLPWRNSTDPYIIWLSEIILQQTRVDQGLNYFHKFIEQYPTVDSLASASEQEVLNLWQGLGYYSRARNLHFTAKYISKNCEGIFPKKYEDILKLKGVGEYTAAAIASFAFNKSYPVIDGNVYRVLSRIFGIKDAIDTTNGKKIFKQLANQLIDSKNPAIYNQAIMEFGALQCTPKKPHCEDCPYLLECYAFKNEVINSLPIKENKLKQRNRYFNYLIFTHDDKIFLKERKGKDIWQGLYDFPLLESTNTIKNFDHIKIGFDQLDLVLENKTIEYKHVLSHQKIYATFWEVTSNNLNKLRSDYTEIDLNKIKNYPVPKLIENYLKLTL